MKFKSLFTLALATIVATPIALAANTQFSAEQQKDIEKIVHDYLVSNPEVLIEASQTLQQKQQQVMQEQAKGAIVSNANQLFNSKYSQTGNPKANVTIVEFFDYQCSHCKQMAPVLNSLQNKDKNLRVVYKEFPIFGKSSEFASQAALAAGMQGKYQQFHDALFKVNKQLDEKTVMDTAKSVGLNINQLKKDMASQTVKDELAANRDQAEKLHLMGTPAIIVAATPNGVFAATPEPAFVPGAASESALAELVNKVSKNS